MLCKTEAGRGRLPTAKRIHDSKVLGKRLPRPAAGTVDTGEDPDTLATVVYQLEERGEHAVAGMKTDLGMQLKVGERVQLVNTVVKLFPGGRELGVQLVQQGHRYRLTGMFDRSALEQLSNREQLAHLRRCYLDDPNRALREDLDEVLRLESQQRLANRRATEAEPSH